MYQIDDLDLLHLLLKQKEVASCWFMMRRWWAGNRICVKVGQLGHSRKAGIINQSFFSPKYWLLQLGCKLQRFTKSKINCKETDYFRVIYRNCTTNNPITVEYINQFVFTLDVFEAQFLILISVIYIQNKFDNTIRQ